VWDLPVSDYAGLISAFKVRREELGLSQFEVGMRCGFQDGYYNKIECWQDRSGRGLSPITLPRILRVLGLRLKVVPVEPSERCERVIRADEALSRVKNSGINLGTLGTRRKPARRRWNAAYQRAWQAARPGYWAEQKRKQRARRLGSHMAATPPNQIP
jgi:transcriptional regulator with XRE-family HTH domain